METPPLPKPGSENLTEQINRSLQQQRDRVREFVASQRRRVDSVESQLSERIKTLLDHIENERREGGATSSQIEQQSEHLSREKETLEQLRKTLDERHGDWQAIQEQAQTKQEHFFDQAWRQGEEIHERLRELLSREGEIQAAEKSLRDDRHAFDLLRKEHEAECNRLDALKEQFEAERTELQSQQEQVAAAKADTEDKRRRIANTLRKQRSEQLQEIHQQRQQLAERDNAQWDQLKTRLDSATGGDNGALLQSIQQQTKHLSEEKEALQQLKETIDQCKEQWETMQEEAQARSEQTLDVLQQRREELESRHGELENRRDELQSRSAELDNRNNELQTRSAEFDDRSRELNDRSSKLDSRAGKLDEREARLETAEQQIRDERHALELTHKEYDTLRCQAEELKEQLQAEQAELQARREQLAAARSKTDSQRRQIAHTLKQQRNSQLEEIERRRKEIDAEENGELAQLRAQLENAGDDESHVSDLRSQLDSAARREGDLAAEVEELKSELRNRPSTTDDDDLTRRYEMVLEDLKELKTSNEELRQQLDEANAGAVRRTTVAASGGALDWEAEKQRILMELEDESQEGGLKDKQRAADHLEIEGIMQMTDKVLAEKDRELADLKLLLENQSDSIGSMAVGAAALGEMLDADPVINEERQNLKRLQAEWQEKLSKAEIAVSTERAALARDRLELEEKVRMSEAASHAQPGETRDAEDTDQPRHRWLTRLGLANDPADEKK